MAQNVTLKRLRALREQFGMTQESLGQLVGVTRQTIAAWEKGDSTPTLAQLFKLSRVMGVPVEVFLKNEQTQADVTLLFRADQPDTLTPEMRMIFAKKAANYAAVEKLLDEAPAMPPARPMDGFNPYLVEEAAEQVRDWLGVDDGPLTDVIERLEGLGVKVFLEELPDKVSGFSAYTNEWGAVIFINRSHPGERQIFTALHELGHLVFHRKEYEGNYEKTKGKNDPREKAVQRFAAAVLLPKDVMLRELRGWEGDYLPLPLLLDIKHRYHVSIRTVVLRASDLGIMPKQKAQKQYGYIQMKFGPENEPDQLPSVEEPKRLRRLVFRALLEEKITISRAAEILQTSIYEIRNELTRWMEVGQE